MESGAIRLDGAPFRPRSPTDAVRAGVGYIPEDRRRQGLVPDFSVRENLLLAHLGIGRGLGLGYDEHGAKLVQLLGDLGLSPRILDDGILTLSGGMQQKIVLARWILISPKVLILDEPTRGVDIATRSAIYAMIRRLAEQGMGVLLVSSDFEEVIGVSDRIVVVSDGADVTSIPSDLVDVEKLAMFAAPRSSAEATHVVLEDLVRRFGGVAYWILVEGERLFCFDSVAAPDAPEIGFSRGIFPEIGDTRIPEALRLRPSHFTVEAAGASMLVPLRGQRGHDLGYVGLTLPAGGARAGPVGDRAHHPRGAFRSGNVGRRPLIWLWGSRLRSIGARRGSGAFFAARGSNCACWRCSRCLPSCCRWCLRISSRSATSST